MVNERKDKKKNDFEDKLDSFDRKFFHEIDILRKEIAGFKVDLKSEQSNFFRDVKENIAQNVDRKFDEISQSRYLDNNSNLSTDTQSQQEINIVLNYVFAKDRIDSLINSYMIEIKDLMYILYYCLIILNSL